MPVRTSQRQPSARHTSATPEATPSDAGQLCETLLAEAPHVGREVEYEAVVAYVARRWSHDANTALFVCGGCGCGKTSTVKRALRAMSHRVLPCDATGRSLVKRGSAEERGWATPTTTRTTQSDAKCVEGNTLAPEVEAPQTMPSAMHTPRTSHQLSSDAAGLSPSPSLSSALHSTSSATTRADSQAWVDAANSLTSSPPSGRPSASSEDSTASAYAAGGSVRASHKRGRQEDDGVDEDAGMQRIHRSEEDSPKARSAAPMRTRRQEQMRHTERAVAAAPAPIPAYSLAYFQMRYPEVFTEAGGASSRPAPRRAASARNLFGHYVNCADVSGPLLIEAICESIQATCTRGNSATEALLDQLSQISSKSSSSSTEHKAGAGRQAQLRRTSASKPPNAAALHVVALDEVEYVRGGGAKTLAQLSELAFRIPGQLALIFISNQRAFVHVPQMMLEALLFEPYSEDQLRRIGADAAAAELHRCELLVIGASSRVVPPAKRSIAGKAAAKPAVSASDVDIKPRLYDYIARKALLEYSGDVRQVIAMCHRVVTVAWEEVTESKAKAEASAASNGRKAVATSRGRKAAPAVSADLPAKLEAAVEAFNSEASGARNSDGRGAGSSGSSSASAAALSARSSAELPPAAPPTSSSGVMTLARSVRLLQSNQVESDIDRYVGTLPEQTLYVLSCIVVLTLRRQEERTHAMTSVGGRMGTSRAPGAGVAAAHRAPPTLSLKLHEVHQLYTRLMTELHFPAMRADGFPMQVDCLADFGVLTRPQLRGTDRIFSLNGTWTLQAMQQALVKRGEAIKQDRLAAGAEVIMENKFEEVLRELSKLMKY